MNAAAEQLDFERAARLRDDLSALKRALEKQAVVLGDGTDADVVAFADDDLEAAVQVFHVRGGRVRGQRGWIVEKPGDPGDSGEAQLVEQFLTQFYGDQAELDGAADESANPVPREVLVPCLPPNADELTTWLSELRGSRVTLRVPRRGDKRALAETVQRNAKEALQQHKLKRAGDFTARSAALQNIQEALGSGRRAACGSNVWTSATSRAPTWWARWWCSRTGCRASPITAISRSGKPPATAVPTTSRRSPR